MVELALAMAHRACLHLFWHEFFEESLSPELYYFSLCGFLHLCSFLYLHFQ